MSETPIPGDIVAFKHADYNYNRHGIVSATDLADPINGQTIEVVSVGGQALVQTTRLRPEDVTVVPVRLGRALHRRLRDYFIEHLAEAGPLPGEDPIDMALRLLDIARTRGVFDKPTEPPTCTGDVPIPPEVVESRFVGPYYLGDDRTGLRFEGLPDIHIPDADEHLALAAKVLREVGLTPMYTTAAPATREATAKIVLGGFRSFPQTEGFKVGERVDLSNFDDTGVRAWRWSLVERPGGSEAAIADPIAAHTWFKLDQPGKYTVELMVNDGHGPRRYRTSLRADGDALVAAMEAAQKATGEQYDILGRPDGSREIACTDPKRLAEIDRGGELADEVVTLRAQVCDCDSQIRSLRSEIETLNDHIVKLGNEREEIAKAVWDERKVGRGDPLLARIREIIAMWDNALDEVRSLRSKLAVAEEHGDTMRTEIQRLRAGAAHVSLNIASPLKEQDPDAIVSAFERTAPRTLFKATRPSATINQLNAIVGPGAAHYCQERGISEVRFEDSPATPDEFEGVLWTIQVGEYEVKGKVYKHGSERWGWRATIDKAMYGMDNFQDLAAVLDDVERHRKNLAARSKLRRVEIWSEQGAPRTRFWYARIEGTEYVGGDFPWEFKASERLTIDGRAVARIVAEGGVVRLTLEADGGPA